MMREKINSVQAKKYFQGANNWPANQVQMTKVKEREPCPYGRKLGICIARSGVPRERI